MSRKSKPFVWDEKAKARLAASLHEAGHFVAAWHYDCAEVSQIWPVGDKFAGESRHLFTSAFNEAVIGWAGPIAEIRLVDSVWRMFNDGQLSKADTDLINRHKDKRKTFNQARKIMAENPEALDTATLEIFRLGNLINFPKFTPRTLQSEKAHR